jgi:sulfate transport system substrate-binding protein
MRLFFSSFLLLIGCFHKEDEIVLLNVSYDPTRELYSQINQSYQKFRSSQKKVRILQSHGGSSKQAGYILAGLRADVVSLAMQTDIDKIAQKGFIEKNWREKKPNQSTPFYSTVVFLVRETNPKKIFDWKDLTQPNIQVITPSPKTSGGGKWNFLAAYGYFLNQDSRTAIQQVKKLYENVPILDTSSRSSASTFIQRKIGDVLIIWENEALLALKESKDQKFEIIYPSMSIYAQPMIAVVNRTVKLKNTEEEANMYLDYLYTKEAQEIIAQNGYRPIDKEIYEKYKNIYKEINLFKVEEVFKSWEEVNKKIFSDGNLLDEVLK